MNIPMNIIVTVIVAEIAMGIIMFWVGDIMLLSYLLFNLLPNSLRIIKHFIYHTHIKHWILLITDEETLRTLIYDHVTPVPHEHVIFVEFNPYMMIHKERYFKLLSSELYKAVHKHRYFKSIHRDLIPIAWHPDRSWRYKEKESQLDFYSLSILFIFCIILKNNSALCVMLSSLDCIYFTVFQRLKDIVYVMLLCSF